MAKSKLPACKILVFINHFLSHNWDHNTVVRGLEISRRTSVDWRSFCSEVTENWFENQSSIGGPEIEVEIDETLITRRKYNRGREVQQVWLFGGIDYCPQKRDKITLIPIIRKYIKPQSIIYSDSWAAYNDLSKIGYSHFKINHSENFVDPEHQNIHTQNIERLWRDVKEHVKRPGIDPKFLKQYLSRYFFIKSISDPSENLHNFLREVAKLYKPE